MIQERSGGWPGRGLALDLVGTVVVPSPGREVDLLATPAGLERWLREEEPWLGPAPPEAALRLADFRALREAIRSLLAAAVAGAAMPAESVRRVNEASAAVPTHRALDVRAPADPVAVDVGADGRTASLLAAIARSAVEAVGDPESRARLRGCPAPGCGRYFRTSRRGQRWCSDACGNRARVARHAARRRAAG